MVSRYLGYRLAIFAVAIVLLGTAGALFLLRVAPLTTHVLNAEINSSATKRPVAVDGFAALPLLLEQPTNGQRAGILGASLLQAGLPGFGVPLLTRAMTDHPQYAPFRLALAEAMILSHRGQVTSAAKALIDDALTDDPNDVIARYYHALWLLQNGRPKQALVLWVGLMRTVGSDPLWYARLWDVMPEAAEQTNVSPLALQALCVAGM